MKDYYFTLGIENSATDMEIKAAYRKLAVRFHPDKNQGDKLYEERFKTIQEAYEILSNNEKRADYDFKFKTTRIVVTTKSNKEQQEVVKRFGEELKKKEHEIKTKYKTAEQKAAEEREIKRREDETWKKQEEEKLLKEIEKHKAELLKKESGKRQKADEIKEVKRRIGERENDIFLIEREIEEKQKQIEKIKENITDEEREINRIKEEETKYDSEKLLINTLINDLEIRIKTLNRPWEEDNSDKINEERTGELFAGGVIVYTVGNGDHGLICSLADVGKSIMADAKNECEAYNAGGFKDWRLPTKEELSMIYDLLYKKKGIKDFAAKNYWSSTINRDEYAWIFDFHSGDSYDYYNKYNAYFVRAVRVF